MKKRILLFVIAGGLVTAVLSSYRTGAARNGYDCTGAETAGSLGNVTGCTNGGCHGSSAAATVNVAIVLDSAGVPTTHYKGGNTYTVTIKGSNRSGTSKPAYGFQLTALTGSASASVNTGAGTWSGSGLPASTRLTPAGSYTALPVLEQSSPIALSDTTFSETFTWTAPASGTGTISFWGVANFVNGNGNADGGDIWNTNSVIINEWPTTAVSTIASDFEIAAFPNPTGSHFCIELKGALEGDYQLEILSVDGRQIVGKNLAVSNNNYRETIATENWMPGLYEVVVTKNGARKILSVLKY